MSVAARSDMGSPARVYACKLGEIPRAAAKVVSVGEERIALFRSGKDVFAVSDACPHKMGPLGEGRVKDGKVECPWHGYTFSLATGESAMGCAVPVFEVEVRGEDVFVSPVPSRGYRDFPEPRPRFVELLSPAPRPSRSTWMTARFYDAVRFAAKRLPAVDRPHMHMGLYTSVDEDVALDVAQERLSEQALDALDAKRGGRLLDVGVGTGATACMAAKRGFRVAGITVSTSERDGARARAQREGLSQRVAVYVADVQRLPFPAGAFDAALAIESINHAWDKRRALEELHRVLAPGAVVSIVEATIEATDLGTRAAAALVGALRPWSRARYERELERAGFVLLDVADWTPSLRRSLREFTRAAPLPEKGRDLIFGAAAEVGRRFERNADSFGYYRIVATRA